MQNSSISLAVVLSTPVNMTVYKAVEGPICETTCYCAKRIMQSLNIHYRTNMVAFLTSCPPQKINATLVSTPKKWLVMALKFDFLLSRFPSCVLWVNLGLSVSFWQIQTSDMIGVKCSSWYSCVKHHKASSDVIRTTNRGTTWHALMKNEILVLWMDLLVKGIRTYMNV